MKNVTLSLQHWKETFHDCRSSCRPRRYLRSMWRLRTRPQHLNVILLSRSQMKMYTGLNPKAFQLLLRWLQPILPCRSKLDTSLHALEEDDEPISSTPTPYGSRYQDNSQKLLLVLMHIRQGLAQEDLEFHFDVDLSSVSRILNQWIPLLAFHLRGLIK